METYRIAVGSAHDVKPGNIVGAIANEAGLDSENIGRVDIHEDYSLIDLPEGMPKKIFRDLQQVWVCGQQLQISRLNESDVPPAPAGLKSVVKGKGRSVRVAPGGRGNH